MDKYGAIYKLNEKDRKVVEHHLKIAAELNKYIEINSWLIEQILYKKVFEIKEDVYQQIL